ncbi:MAG: chorismate mutase [Oligoflexia bacterium]|nr:chorismate mutase [Oligoflexia bacterium]
MKQSKKRADAVKSISCLRKEIDVINISLVSLFLKRFVIAKEILEIKKQFNLPIYDRKREKQMYLRSTRKLRKKEKTIARSFLKSVFVLTLKKQKRKLLMK